MTPYAQKENTLNRARFTINQISQKLSLVVKFDPRKNFIPMVTTLACFVKLNSKKSTRALDYRIEKITLSRAKLPHHI